jgi:ATP-dependent protease ClpP protease subunit
MKILRQILFPAVFAVLLAPGSACFADTFRHEQTKALLHGYATSKTADGNTIVHTQEKGVVGLNLAEWRITTDRLGRNNKVVVLTVDDKIMLQIETDALVEAITKSADQGPLFILLEIDTPGGRVDFTRRICGAIAQMDTCPVFAFVRGGEYGGAISAGAAVALACNKIYMANGTVIGAAAPIVAGKAGPRDLKESYGEEVGEKLSSAWRTYLASLAQQNNRPGLLACAMVDRDIEVVEVSQAEHRLFIDPVNITQQQQLVHTWSKKGSLLTLTAEDAVKCEIADKVVGSREELLRYLEAGKAEIVTDDSFQEASRQFRRAKLRFNQLSKSLDLNIKQLQQTDIRVRALKLLNDIRKDYKSLVTLAKHYPDLHINVQLLEAQLNTAEALYQQAKMRR